MRFDCPGCCSSYHAWVSEAALVFSAFDARLTAPDQRTHFRCKHPPIGRRQPQSRFCFSSALPFAASNPRLVAEGKSKRTSNTRLFAQRTYANLRSNICRHRHGMSIPIRALISAKRNEIGKGYFVPTLAKNPLPAHSLNQPFTALARSSDCASGTSRHASTAWPTVLPRESAESIANCGRSSSMRQT
jgi:hypothetical protein